MKSRSKINLLASLISLFLAGMVVTTAGAATTITRVSVNSSGVEGNNNSSNSSISADGRYVVFSSDATNLVSEDANGFEDVFMYDTQTATITRLSLNSTGVEGNNGSGEPSISPDGRYVAFYSRASNLVSGDNNGVGDIFVRDTQEGTITRVSLDSSGAEVTGESRAPSISSNGRYVAFWSYASDLVGDDTNACEDVFVHDTQENTTVRVSVDSSENEGNNTSYNPSISSDGRYVAFESYASNLVSGDTDSYDDIFVRDTQLGTTIIVSMDSSGTQANNYSYYPSISSDGRYVAFQSEASNLVGEDTNSSMDVFLHDAQTGETKRISVDAGGTEGNSYSSSSMITPDGRYVVFQSSASNLVSGDNNSSGDIFVFPAFMLYSYQLSVNKTGGGSGTVTSSPAGISCGSTCSESFLYNTSVTLTASPAADSKFTGWSGAGCSGKGNCVVFMTEARSVSARFALIKTLTLRSTGSQDGWILESSETSDAGSTKNSTATNFYVGDNAQKKQYRGILSFNTAGLPDTAVLLKVTLKLKLQGTTGTDPFTTHGNLVVDVRNGAFDNNSNLQLTDFMATADKNAVGVIPATPVSGWHTKIWTSGIFGYINKTDLTQFRLRFAKDDDNDTIADYLKFYSGDAGMASYRPQLIVEYYVP